MNHKRSLARGPSGRNGCSIGRGLSILLYWLQKTEGLFFLHSHVQELHFSPVGMWHLKAEQLHFVNSDICGITTHFLTKSSKESSNNFTHNLLLNFFFLSSICVLCACASVAFFLSQRWRQDRHHRVDQLKTKNRRFPIF